MSNPMRPLAGWGNFPVVQSEVSEPGDRAAIRDYVLENERFIARGNGKSYGDAALAPRVLSTLRLNRLRAFDAENGIIECESGLLLFDLLKIILPAGWFFQVTPGIKFITVGGAIASDVHGKNHPLKGCFSNWLISFELMTASGEILTCSRTENPRLFWHTCGGMGWTGVILSARFQLMRITSTQMQQRTLRAPNWEKLLDIIQENIDASYAAAWVDCTATGRSFGRGAVHLAEHYPTPDPSPAGRGDTALRAPSRRATPLPAGEGPGVGSRNIPFFAPNWLLNPVSIRAYNSLYFNKNRDNERLVGFDSYFYPLDSLRNWNRLYGRRGFVQYQFCLPEKTAFDGLVKVLETIQKSPECPFLTVMKRHGEQPLEALNAFPIRGYSLALDFPRTPTIFDLVKKLDDLVWDLGGKIYLAKDSCSAPRMGRVHPATFGDPKFSSHLRQRIERGLG
jgi:FAD/FMN-containing dehydrogenase